LVLAEAEMEAIMLDLEQPHKAATVVLAGRISLPTTYRQHLALLAEQSRSPLPLAAQAELEQVQLAELAAAAAAAA